MKRKFLFKKSVVIGIIIIFVFSSFVPSIGGYSEETNEKNINVTDIHEPSENVLINCQTYGFPGELSQEDITIPIEEAEAFYNKIKELQIVIANNPISDKAQQLQHEILSIADEYNLLPAGLSVDTIKSRLTPFKNTKYSSILPQPRLPGRASAFFCNYVSTGAGSSLPVIIFPRLIPILLTPIPRLFVTWNAHTPDAVTSCGGMLTGKGFIAYGSQNGIALGFWGIGFSIFLPPIMAYGLLGYALYVTVNAEDIEPFPPNYPPEISVVSPLDGAENVPVSTSELEFYISDYNGDLMSYSVTTEPDIGSGSGNNKPDGTYIVPISDLEGTEEYTWHIQVSDGEDMEEVSYNFNTEPVAPIISDINPEEDARYVPIELSKLSFNLKDPQGDLMDYTVETVPNIGSGSGNGVGDGTYTIDIIGLDYSQEYKWYINVTDGANWKHKSFDFQAEHQLVFDPFEGGWQYRKKIIIDHTNVDGDLSSFPVLISTIDSDLKDKAQNDGDDILFMDGDGITNRLYHEIEQFDRSSGELVAWVNIPDLSSNQDTTLYMYYGNPSSCNQHSPELVWDSNYVLVLHMNNMEDSTGYNNDAEDYSTSDTEGKIGRARDFSGNHYMIIEDDSTLDFGDGDDFTIESWIKTDDDDREMVISKYDGINGYHTASWYTDKLMFGVKSNGGQYLDIQPNGKVNDNQWHYILGYRTSEGIIWARTDLGASVSRNAPGSIVNSQDIYIGQRVDGTKSNDGVIDEIRISNIERSDAWISTGYTNQYDPLNFLSFGSEETGP